MPLHLKTKERTTLGQYLKIEAKLIITTPLEKKNKNIACTAPES